MAGFNIEKVGDGATTALENVATNKGANALMLLVVGYLAAALAYGVLGTANGSQGGYQPDVRKSPRYTLVSNIPAYAAQGINATATTDVAYVSSSVYAPSNYDVYVDHHTLGGLIASFVLYLVAVMYVGWSKFQGDVNVVAALTLAATQAILFCLVQSDLMYVFGNNSHVASWLAAGCIAAQSVIYFVGENEKLVAKSKQDKQVADVVHKAVAAAAIVVGTFLVSVVVGVALIGTVSIVNAAGTVTIPVEYMAVFSVYVTVQILEWIRFCVNVVYGVNASEKLNKMTKGNWAKIAESNVSAVIMHVLVFVLALVYAFVPGKLIGQVGLI